MTGPIHAQARDIITDAFARFDLIDLGQMGRVQIDMVSEHTQRHIQMQVLICKILNLLHILGTDVLDLVGRAFFEFAQHTERPFPKFADGSENFPTLQILDIIAH
ncbi:hypothetical protein D3C74_451280 [compost metagenome]